MPLRKHRLSSLITRLVLLSLAAVCLAVLRPGKRAHARVVQARPRRRSGLRRAAVSLTFATLFFAGAAFSAGAGGMLVEVVEGQATSAASAPAPAAADDLDCADLRRSDWDAEDSACPEEAPAEAAAPDAATPESTPEAAPEATPEAAPVAAPDASAPETASPETASPATAAAIAEAAGQVASEATAPAAKPGRTHKPSLQTAVRSRVQKSSRRQAPKGPPVIKPARVHEHAADPDPEVDLPGLSPTIWLHRALPDPTPPSRRLSRRFAANLRFASSRNGVDWALMLGTLRARGYRGAEPASKAGLDRLARNLVRLNARNDQWNALLALEGRTAFADRALALTRYHRAVGLRALVGGLEAAKPRLVKKLLRDRRVSIYSGGRADIASGRIDIRVIVLIQYLAESHGQVTVSSLKSGHRLYSRPGVISAHSYGQAVDIAALAGKSIIGNQEPGGLTELAVRNVLLLPAELRPMQVISLLGLGGPSFPMGNHDDHIHLGF